MGRPKNEKTYFSAAQKAKTEGERRTHKQRKPPPRFSNLFIKKKVNEESEEHSKENIGLFGTGTKTEELLGNSHTGYNLRNPLGVNSYLTNSLNSASGPSFNDTFDKLLCTSRAPQSYPQYLCSSTSESLVEPSGLLFKSLLNTGASWIYHASPHHDEKLINNHAAAVSKSKLTNHQDNANKPNQQNTSPVKQMLSPQLFTSSDMIMEKKYSEASGHHSQDKAEITEKRRGTRKRRGTHWRMKTKTVKGTPDYESQRTKNIPAAEDSNPDSCVRKEPVICKLLPTEKTQPSPIVQRFLRSLELGSPSAHSKPPLSSLPTTATTTITTLTPKEEHNSPVVHRQEPQSRPSINSQHSGKSSTKSSIHTSTPRESSMFHTVVRRGSKWSLQASPSLENKVSPVPREQSMVTDDSNGTSVFQSPASQKTNNSWSVQQELGGSPSLGSNYKTCTSVKKTHEGNNGSTSASNQLFVTGETCESQTCNKLPSFYNSSLETTSGPFKDAKTPAFNLNSLSDHSFSHSDCNSADEKIRLDSESSVVIGKKPKSRKTIKRLESSQSSSAVVSPKKFITGRNRKSVSPFKFSIRFSPKVTRNRSRMLKHTSEESHASDFNHVRNNVTSVCMSRKEALTVNRNSRSLRKYSIKENVPKRTSRKLAAQKIDCSGESQMTHDSIMSLSEELSVGASLEDKSASHLLPVPLESMTMRRKNTQAYMGGTGLLPIPRKSKRLSEKDRIRKRSSHGLVRRSSRLAIQNYTKSNRSRGRSHIPLQASNEMGNRQAEVSVAFTISTSDFSSFIKFRKRRGRKADDIIYQRNYSHSSSTTTEDTHSDCSLSSQQTDQEEVCCTEDEVLSHPSEQLQQYREEGLSATASSYKTDNDSTSACGFIQDCVVMLEDININRSVAPLSTHLTKPGKGWRRSIAIKSRPVSLTSGEHLNGALPLQRTPKRTSELCRSSFTLDTSQAHHPTVTDSPRQSALQMSFYGKAVPVRWDPQQQVLDLCSQEEPVPLTECFTESRLACCSKIGEGVYGEVFMTRPNSGSLEDAAVLKIMPIEGDFLVNGEPQKLFEEIMTEMVISLELSKLRDPERMCSMTENFVHVLRSWCVEGQYPQDLLHLWDLYNETKGSENDRPDMFPDSQLYVVLEFSHGGKDLEKYEFNSARDLMAVFLQIAYSLAVAEEALEFEHRDLHWGNVLIAKTSESKIDYKLSGNTYNLNTYGLKATVIDFTLSRAKLPDCVVFNNLAEDPTLFLSGGDYQFDIYRLMQSANNNKWESFTPYTNVLWLHYLLVKMTSECYIKNSNTKLHHNHLTQMKTMRDTMLSYQSATHFVLSRESES